MTGLEILAAVLCGLYLLFLAGIFRLLFWNSDRWKEKGPSLPEDADYAPYKRQMEELVGAMQKQTPAEEIRIPAADGTSLYGRYYPGKENAPIALLFHGYHGGAERDMCGAHKISREHGISAILIDQRAHGKSGGNVITFGIREQEDTRRWAAYCRERFGQEKKVILYGISMGAAAVLMAAKEPLPDNVCGIIADCPYESPGAIIRTVMKRMHVSFLWPSVVLSAALFGHFRLTGRSALAGIRRTDLPVLLLHGEQDHFVPVSMSEDLARAGKHTELFTFPGAAHGISYLTDPGRYTRAVLDFFSTAAGWESREEKPGKEETA